MSELIPTLIFGSYGFTLLVTKFLYGRTEKAARKEDMERLEGKLDDIYYFLLNKKERPKPTDSSTR